MNNDTSFIFSCISPLSAVASDVPKIEWWKGRKGERSKGERACYRQCIQKTKQPPPPAPSSLPLLYNDKLHGLLEWEGRGEGGGVIVSRGPTYIYIRILLNTIEKIITNNQPKGYFIPYLVNPTEILFRLRTIRHCHVRKFQYVTHKPTDIIDRLIVESSVAIMLL